MNAKKDDEKEVPKTGHVYDGIEELDHPAPNWFMALFYATIAFGLVYFLYYSVGEGPTLTEEYRKAKEAEAYALYQGGDSGGAKKQWTEAELAAFVQDPAKRKQGAASFQAKCASCHGAQGQGGIGPNLTDAYWLHGAKMTEMVATITNGVPDKGMPPWGAVLSADEVHALAAHIRSLAGSNPAGAKAPQGTLVKPGS